MGSRTNKVVADIRKRLTACTKRVETQEARKSYLLSQIRRYWANLNCPTCRRRLVDYGTWLPTRNNVGLNPIACSKFKCRVNRCCIAVPAPCGYSSIGRASACHAEGWGIVLPYPLKYLERFA